MSMKLIHFRIDWDASATLISGYNIYRGGADGNQSNIPLNNSPIEENFWIDETVFPGMTYSYSVTSVFNGVESPESLDIISTPVAFPFSPAKIDLGAAAGFGLLAYSTITNVDDSETVVSGDIGIFPGTSVTGFGTSTSMSGSMHVADYVSGYAQSSLSIAMADAIAIPNGVTIDGDIGGQKIGPGIYKNASSLLITGTLILDAGSDPNAVWIFQIGSTLTTASEDSNVILIGGAQAANVYWIVGSSATLGSYTTFAGNILAQSSITVNTGTDVNGRLLAKTGGITLDGNSILIFSASPCGLEHLPPSPPNVPPAPPLAPTNLHITPIVASAPTSELL